MKKLNLIFLVCIACSFAGCETLSSIASSTTGSGSSEPTDAEIGAGLKEALNVGISKGVEELIKVDGYFKNELIKIIMPPEALKVEGVMRKYIPNGDKLVDDVVLKMNRAAEDAANEAKPIFVNAIKGLSFKDVRDILFGAENAAT
ncbi:MAG: DUF4197 domain-containing protein, partial [Bacteroidota bacterium]